MPDNFALLDEPRRPWVNVESVKAKFLALSATAHPDRSHSLPESERLAATARYTELNAAFRCLINPKERLQHLLELELGRKPSHIQQPPSGMADLLMDAGQLCRGVDQFLVERSSATSPMLKVKLFERGLDWTDKLMSLQQNTQARQAELDARLQSLNTTWEAAPQAGDPSRAAHLPLAMLEELYRESAYLARCAGQLRERVVQLAL